MNKKQPPPKSQIITANAPGLPSEFMAIEADDSYEAAGMVQEAFSDPSITLVVWSNAADLIPENLKQSVRALSILRDAKRQQASTEIVPGLWRSLFSDDDELEENAVKRHFSKLVALTGHRGDILKEWQENCLDIACDLIESFDAKSLKLSTIFQRHGDNRDGIYTARDLRSDSLSIVRAVEGASALYYGIADAGGQRPWTVRPWDFAFVSRNVAQQTPASAIGFEAEARCVVEIYDLRGRYEFVAGARRPLRKTFSRWPQPD